ncbi:DUF211 domain-containing protein [Streptomyces noursei]|uniref:DUF211 domain-containing protein n=1 Tax=Streptomyces noursei TaxID=1971 RepID=UPI0005C85D0C|nr:DUF211 domain-containing protein [Streptomyces noursei]
MNLRRVVMDVDKAIQQPDILELATAMEAVTGVEAVNITVTEIDIETVGMNVTVEGDAINWSALVHAIEQTGAALHSIDQLAVGERIIEGVNRAR